MKGNKSIKEDFTEFLRRNCPHFLIFYLFLNHSYMTLVHIIPPLSSSTKQSYFCMPSFLNTLPFGSDDHYLLLGILLTLSFHERALSWLFLLLSLSLLYFLNSFFTSKRCSQSLVMCFFLRSVKLFSLNIFTYTIISVIIYTQIAYTHISSLISPLSFTLI